METTSSAVATKAVPTVDGLSLALLLSAIAAMPFLFDLAVALGIAR
jgi:hypothetical protein